MKVFLCKCAAPFSLVLMLCMTNSAAFGQATTGSISGRVTDATQGILPGAAVIAHNTANGVETTAVTASDGDFNLRALPPSDYTLTVSHDGFKTTKLGPFKLDIDQKARFDVSLAVGGGNEVVTVTDAVPVLQTYGAETGQVIGRREIQDLPLKGRDFVGLMLLVPGVVYGSGGNSMNLSVNGQREFTNSVQVNGNETTSNRNNDASIKPSVDAMQEFKVVTSDYAPEFGRAAGGAIIIQTRAGTNNWHGGIYEFFRPNNTAAANRSFGTDTKVAPQLKQHNFGVTFGGPIQHDKTFFFAAYEGVRQVDGYNYLSVVPFKNQVSFRSNGDADLSGLLDPYTGNQIPIFDPDITAANYGGYVEQFPGNIIPANRVSPAGKLILSQMFPTPQTTDPYGNYFNIQHYKYDSNTGNFRMDRTFSPNDRVYLTYDIGQYRTSTSDPFGNDIPIPGGGGADSGDRTSGENQAAGATYDHTFSQSLLNEFRAGLFISALAQNSLLDGSQLANQFGIQNANVPDFPATNAFPQIQFQSGAITGGSTYKPLTFRDRNLMIADSLTWTRGRHNVKIGYEYRHLHAQPNFSLFPTPYEYFGGAYSALTSDINYCQYSYDPSCGSSQLPYGFYDGNAMYATGGNEIADLLLGLPSQVSQGLQLTNPVTTANEHTFYAQDYFQLTPTLNITFGVRYEYQQPYMEVNNHASNLDISTLSVKLAGVGANSRSLVNSDRNNFAPRIGISWRANQKTVLRAGYGMFFSPENDAKSDVLTKNYPFFTQQQFFNSPYSGLPYSFNLDAGYPHVTSVNIPAGTSSIAMTTVPDSTVYTIYYVQPNSPTAYSQSYNFTVQRDLGRGMSAEIGYVSAVARKLSYGVGNLNLDQGGGNVISPLLGQIQGILPVGSSNYNSLQTKITKPFSNGYSVLVSYTYSKSLDNGPAPFNRQSGNQQPQNPYNLLAEYGLSSSDVRHNLVMSQVIELPVGRGKWLLRNAGPLTQTLFGGWQLNSITVLHSGLPVNIVVNGNDSVHPGYRPNKIHNLRNPHTIDQWFDKSAFHANTDPGNPSQTLAGNAGRNIVIGPGYTNEDVSLFKTFDVAKQWKIQFRAEAFNVLNTPHYAQPEGNMASGKFGTISGTLGGPVGPRIMQFAVKINY